MTPNIHVLARGVLIIDEHILLCRTLDLEPDFFFIPGGHIEQGESAAQALLRELKEEVGHDFIIDRFLGCLEYSFDPGKHQHAKCHTHEYNFFFTVDTNSPLGPKMPLKQLESHIEILWMPLDKLNDIDLRPAPLKTLLPKWLAAGENIAFESEMVKEL